MNISLASLPGAKQLLDNNVGAWLKQRHGTVEENYGGFGIGTDANAVPGVQFLIAEAGDEFGLAETQYLNLAKSNVQEGLRWLRGSRGLAS